MPEAWNKPIRFPTSSLLYQLPMMYWVPLYVDASTTPWKNRTAARWENLVQAAQTMVRTAHTNVIRGNHIRGATF